MLFKVILRFEVVFLFLKWKWGGGGGGGRVDWGEISSQDYIHNHKNTKGLQNYKPFVLSLKIVNRWQIVEELLNRDILGVPRDERSNQSEPEWLKEQESSCIFHTVSNLAKFYYNFMGQVGQLAHLVACYIYQSDTMIKRNNITSTMFSLNLSHALICYIRTFTPLHSAQ